MTEYTMGPRDEGFLLSEANGYQSRDEITLKKSANIYQPGSIVVLISGKYELATALNIEDSVAAIIARLTDATEADVSAAAITSHAEVKDTELVFDDSLELSDVTELLADQNIKVRKAI